MKRRATIFKSKRYLTLSPSPNQISLASLLFERPPPPDYIHEWTEALMQFPPLEENQKNLSVMIFRLGKEWLALPTVFCKEVTSRRPIHRIPHHNNKILLGIVNLNGELKLYVSLDHLLEVESSSLNPSHFSYQQDRMMAIAKENELWVFPVDEIEGIYNFDLSLMENVPVNVSKSTVSYIKGIIKMDDKGVGLLDEELLFASLKRSIQ